MSKPLIFGTGGCIVLILAIGSFLLPGSVRESIHAASFTVTSPVWHGVAWLQEFGRQTLLNLHNIKELRNEAEMLRRENAHLKTENARSKELESKVVRYKEMVGFKREKTNYRLMAAKVIERDPATWWNSVVIDRGWEDDPDLKADLPVLSPRGVVGKTGTVGASTTRVILLVDPNCKISVVTGETRARGIMIGGSQRKGGRPVCRFTYVARETDFKMGELVYTTGLGGAFPPNLLVGVIRERTPLSTEQNFGLFRDGQVEPAVDLENIQELFVLMGLQ